MTPFPPGSRDPILPAVTACIEAGCERDAIVAGTRCRPHLVDAQRIEGATYLPDHPERAEMFAAVEQIVEVALADLPPERQTGGAPWVDFVLYVLLPRDAELATAQMAMELLAVGIADRFGGSRVWRPNAYMGDVMLHAQVGGPRSEEFRAALGFALAAVTTEFLGPDAEASFGVAPVGEQASVVAVLQASFPSGTDPDFFAEGFGTRDYFRWQMELGETPGVGAIQSEPCTVLGSEAPDFDVLPPNLMNSFAVTGNVDAVVPGVVQDLKQRLARTIQPTEVLVGIFVTLEGTTPGSVQAEIERWRSRGYQLLELDDEALRRPMVSTRLLFEFPAA